MSFGKTKLSLLLSVVGCAGVFSLALGIGDGHLFHTAAEEYELMSLSEQLAVIGGDPVPDKLCTSEEGDECNKPDTLCSEGDDNCDTLRILDAYCGGKRLYHGLVRCNDVDTSLCCEEDETITTGICYTTSICRCESFLGVWSCVTEMESETQFVPQCSVTICPPGGGES